MPGADNRTIELTTQLNQKFCGITIDTMDPIAARYNETVGNLSGLAVRPNRIPKIPTIKIQGPKAYFFSNFLLVCGAMDDASQNTTPRFS